jgi:hypothetical protein
VRHAQSYSILRAKICVGQLKAVELKVIRQIIFSNLVTFQLDSWMCNVAFGRAASVEGQTDSHIISILQLRWIYWGMGAYRYHFHLFTFT